MHCCCCLDMTVLGFVEFRGYVRYLRRQHLVDVTEIFNHLDYEKTYRLLKLGFYLVLLLVVIYRCSILLITPQFLIEIAIENCCYTCCIFEGISIACLLVVINKYIFTPYQCWPDFQLVWGRYTPCTILWGIYLPDLIPTKNQLVLKIQIEHGRY